MRSRTAVNLKAQKKELRLLIRKTLPLLKKIDQAVIKEQWSYILSAINVVIVKTKKIERITDECTRAKPLTKSKKK